MKMYDLEERLVQFSASIIIGITTLKKTFASEHLTKQLIRSATSAALNYGEAQAAESKRDFIHKMKICLKELRESQINLKILKEADLIMDDEKMKSITQECKELVAIFTSSIKTTKEK
ncbi:MAG: four helix bundle protein [Flavobacteriaceae bacterium]